jgi:hypothetical protein
MYYIIEITLSTGFRSIKKCNLHIVSKINNHIKIPKYYTLQCVNLQFEIETFTFTRIFYTSKTSEKRSNYLYSYFQFLRSR